MIFPNHNEKLELCECRVCFWGRYDDSAFKRFEQNANEKLSTPPLEVRVARDIESLTAGFDGKGGKELPEPEYADLTTYRDAYAFAVANCMHANIEIDDPFNPVNIDCNDCSRTMTYTTFFQERERLSAKNTVRARYNRRLR